MSQDKNGDEDGDASYIDYETFLAPDFSPAAFANTLVLAMNNPNDAPLDLSTPLSRVLFDMQEIDSHIDRLTTRSALPLLNHTQEQNAASGRIVAELDPQIESLNDSYRQLEKEVVQKHAEAEQVRLVASRLWETLWLGRTVSRCLQLGRQLEVQHAELTGAGPAASAPSGGSGSSSGSGPDTLPNSSITAITPRKEDHRALARCAHTILSIHELLRPTRHSRKTDEPAGDATLQQQQQQQTEHQRLALSRLDAIRTLQDGVLAPIERTVRETAERLVREFALPPTATFAQAEAAKARTVSALTTLYLLSPVDGTTTTAAAGGRTTGGGDRWAPVLMLHSLESYLRTALQSSLAALARSLAQLPTLERTLAEVAARCQNVVALEAVLGATRAPVHPLLVAGDIPATAAAGAAATPAAPAERSSSSRQGSLLQPLLAHLETGSLASYFWRTMAGGLATRVQEIVNRGGVAARTLRSSRNSVAEAIRECVVRGSQLPSAAAAGGSGGVAGAKGARPKGAAGVGGKSGDEDAEGEAERNARWEREVAVMVGSVVGSLPR